MCARAGGDCAVTRLISWCLTERIVTSAVDSLVTELFETARRRWRFLREEAARSAAARVQAAEAVQARSRAAEAAHAAAEDAARREAAKKTERKRAAGRRAVRKKVAVVTTGYEDFIDDSSESGSPVKPRGASGGRASLITPARPTAGGGAAAGDLPRWCKPTASSERKTARAASPEPPRGRTAFHSVVSLSSSASRVVGPALSPHCAPPPSLTVAVLTEAAAYRDVPIQARCAARAVCLILGIAPLKTEKPIGGGLSVRRVAVPGKGARSFSDYWTPLSRDLLVDPPAFLHLLATADCGAIGDDVLAQLATMLRKPEASASVGTFESVPATLGLLRWAHDVHTKAKRLQRTRLRG